MSGGYITPAEVAVHNTHTDCWVSFLGRVFDLTKLVAENEGILTQPIVAAAGTDISQWFDARTGDVRTHVDPVTGTLAYYTPQGRFVHVLPNTPVTDQVTVVETPWWMDPQYQIGLLSLNVRPIKLLNTLTQQEHELEVPGEETLNEILTRCARRLKLPLLFARFPRPRPRVEPSRFGRRYLPYNSHAASYTWKFLGNVLDMSLTLEQNGVPDERELYAKLNLVRAELLPLRNFLPTGANRLCPRSRMISMRR